ncbi:hypothetical protein [Fangia hongkongensis]|uniref:hypothetical protein n=1 Tax=Fangia hongkongensis TaxID=270495 RepID=UPI00035C4EDA|nr:hypothetical protein [Fangia hongkongensis]
MLRAQKQGKLSLCIKLLCFFVVMLVLYFAVFFFVIKTGQSDKNESAAPVPLNTGSKEAGDINNLHMNVKKSSVDNVD